MTLAPTLLIIAFWTAVALVVAVRLGAAIRRHQPAAPVLAAIAQGEAARLLDAGERGEFGWCPNCQRTQYHAIHPDGSRSCWTCRTTQGGAQ